MNGYALFFLVAVAIGGVTWVFIYPIISGERHAERRKASVARAEPIAARPTRAAQKSRREQVEGTLKDIEQRQKTARRVPLAIRITQAGLTWSKRRFLLTAGALGVAAFLVALPTGAGLLAALGFAFTAGVGLPLWLLSFLKRRREARFLDTFPDAVDVIVRGIKAGLPLLDNFKLIAADAQEPVRSEFRTIIETQTIGLTLGEACLKLYERMPLPEANFFGIVISVHQRAGGNLSEALGNLSRVLRDRKTHESQDPGHVHGGQGLGDHHRCAADRGPGARLFHQPAIHRALVDDLDGARDAGRLRAVDDHGHPGDAQDDQLRFLRRDQCSD